MYAAELYQPFNILRVCKTLSGYIKTSKRIRRLTFVAGYCHRDTVDIPMALGILRKVAADLCMALCVWSSYAANLRTQSTDPRARITDFPPADHWKPSGSPKNLHSLERLDETLL